MDLPKRLRNACYRFTTAPVVLRESKSPLMCLLWGTFLIKSSRGEKGRMAEMSTPI